MSSLYNIFVRAVEHLGQQLDPDYKFQLGSPSNYFSQYEVKDYIRVVIMVGAYALIIRPLIEKFMNWARDRDAKSGGTGAEPGGARAIPVELPAWQDASDDEEVDGKLEWGKRLRKRVKAAQREAEKSVDTDAQDERDIVRKPYAVVKCKTNTSRTSILIRLALLNSMRTSVESETCA